MSSTRVADVLSFSGNGKQVLLLTSTNLTANPRCRKELELLAEMGARVQVVAFHLSAWTNKYDAVLTEQYPSDRIQIDYLSTNRKKPILWLFYSFLELVGKLFLRIFPSNLFFAAAAISKRSFQLLNWNPPLGFKPVLIIAHNPAAFYTAFHLARKWTVPFALDIEDYHPGEKNAKSAKMASFCLMSHLIKRAAYVSYASPLILNHTLQQLNMKSGNHIVVNNVFPRDEFQKIIKNDADGSKIKLVWFSQVIDYGRGLERIFPVLDQYRDFFSLTLIGSLRIDFRDRELNSRDYITHLGPLEQRKLHAELGRYDIGLALEDPAEDLNRDICLTNKIWAYFQSGLFILASQTAAQRDFFSRFPDHGVLTGLSVESISASLNHILAGRDLILSNYSNRFELAQNCSWNTESDGLVRQWNQFLQKTIS